MINVQSVLETCVGCGACSNICPNDSIEMKQDPYGFLFPSVNADTCIDCHQCEKVCMALNGVENLLQDNGKSKYYAAWATKENMAPNATSGGIATVLARNFFENGKVFGAAFCNGMVDLRHIECGSLEDVSSIAGSKYLQSNTTESLAKVKSALANGEKVLYIGTPCQIAGLKKYLKKDYENLFTIDFFCHGVPSPLAWEKHVNYLEKKYRAKLTGYNFRAKLRGWGRLEQSAEFSPRRVFLDVGPFNVYHTWFGTHWSIRSSCFHCQFRSNKRVSDITVADFWKIEQYYPDIPTKQGVSCVILNTKRGKNLFEESVQKQQIVAKSVSYESVWEKRKTTQSNFEEPIERHKFLENLKLMSPEELVRCYPAAKLMKQIVNALKARIAFLYR